MDNLKPCPFCGGEVTIAETGADTKKWMFISRAHVFLWKAESIGLVALKRIKKESEPTLSKHGINEFDKS